MRTLEETRLRWEATISKCGSLAELQQAVKSNGSSSPCLSGCRSLCWKIFLVFNTTDTEKWSTTLAETRNKYEENRTRFLQYIKHPEALAEVASDPLADDPESPWTAVRQDEVIRAEIEQDVQRLPGDANYHDPQIQQIVLDVLFVYCKMHPERGGYRQGMHEILAPIVHVLEQDAITRPSATDNTLDLPMLDMLDTKYLEHDAYTLFSHLMEHAKSFYEVVEANNAAENSSMQGQSSTIVERSRQIHEVYLHKIDPDLAVHLKNIEILPQIFLIRWIRLLYNREFPFTQFLVLWDTIFAVDPTLSLIDLISCAMILRIRWQLLEGDYSVCLQHLLKYPAPDAAHGPHTFVDDALYLKQNLDFAGGSHLIMKYSSRMPEPPGSVSSVVSSPHSTLKRERVNKASLPSPTKFIQQQQGNVESFLQGAAKSAKDVLERGERLGLNQAVRDAMGELRRNMQSLNESRSLNRGSLGGEAAKTLALMEARNNQLATLLEETVANLKTAAASGLEDKVKSLELIEIAAAKAQFVQIYLQDVSMEVPSYGASKEKKQAPPAQPASLAASAVPAKSTVPKPLPPTPQKSAPALSPAPTASMPIRSTEPSAPKTAPVPAKPAAAAANPQTDAAVPNPEPAASQQQQQQPAPGPAEPKLEEAKTPIPSVPKRSTIAQSSFSWMLEPDEPASPQSPVNSVKSPTFPSKSNRRSGNLSRDKNAFLFGDGDEANSNDPAGSTSEGIFGMESMPKPKK